MIKKIPLLTYYRKERLELQLTTLTPRVFERAYRQRPFSDDDILFPSFKDCISYTGKNPDIMEYWCGVDLSGKRRSGTVIVTLGYLLGKKYLVDVRLGAWNAAQKSEQIVQVISQFSPKMMMVENNALQEDLIELILIQHPKCKSFIKGYRTGRSKMDEKIGIPSMESEFLNRDWIINIPKHGLDCNCAVCNLVQQVCAYPGASYDDIVMAMFFAREGIRLYAREPAPVQKDPYDSSGFKLPVWDPFSGEKKPGVNIKYKRRI